MQNTGFSILNGRALLRGVSGFGLLSAAMCGLLPATAAHAQESTDGESGAEEGARPGAVITVTARRREENLQEVPIAITAFDTEALAEKGVTNGFELQRAAPGLVASTSAGRSDGLTYSMRGQSNTYGSGGASVIVYFADVPQAAGSAGAPFYDLASVQVLGGPQGTLFGQSSTGGAVLFAPKRPTSELEGYLKASVGNLNLRRFEGAVNIPVTDTLAIRVAGNILRRDGFTQDLTSGLDLDDQSEENWRVGVEWTPTDWFENYLVVDGRHSQTNGTAYSLYQVFGPGLLLPDGSFVDALEDQEDRGIRTIETTPDRPTPNTELRNWGLSNTSEFDFGSITVKNVFGYRTAIGQQNNYVDGDGSPLEILAQFPANFFPNIPAGFESGNGNSRVISNELQVSGTALDDRIDWIVGGFYSRSKSGINQPNFSVASPVYNYVCSVPGPGCTLDVLGDPAAVIAGVTGAAYRNSATVTSKAIFAQGTFEIVDGLNFTAGIRRSKDKSVNGSSIFGAGAILPAPDGPIKFANFPSQPGAVLNSSGTTWNLSLDYQLSDDVLVYVASRRGYKAGQAATTLYPIDQATYGSLVKDIQPETVQDFEVGVKTEWTSGNVFGRFNASGYYSNYKNIQRQVASALSSAPIGFNVEKARIIGLELAATVATGGFSLDGTYAYTDPEYTSFLNPFAGPGQGSDQTSNPFGFVSRHKFNLSARYEADLADAGILALSAGYSWQDKFFYTEQSFNFPDATVPSHGLMNARVQLSEIAGTQVSIAAFVDNLTDEEYIENGNLDAGLVGRVFYGAPRTYGLELGLEF